MGHFPPEPVREAERGGRRCKFYFGDIQSCVGTEKFVDFPYVALMFYDMPPLLYRWLETHLSQNLVGGIQRYGVFKFCGAVVAPRPFKG
jgi:hypothetical protein